MATTVSSIAELIDALGGPTKAAKTLGVKSAQRVVNWRLNGKITPELLTSHQSILSALGITAPASLWGQIDLTREPIA